MHVLLSHATGVINCCAVDAQYTLQMQQSGKLILVISSLGKKPNVIMQV